MLKTTFFFTYKFAFILLIFSILACGGGGGSSSTRGNSTLLNKELTYQTRCGLVIEGSLQQTSSARDAESVSVEPISGDTLIVTRLEGAQAGSTQLVKLHGVSSGNSFSNSLAVDRIRATLGSEPAALVIPSYDGSCGVFVAGGGEGVVAQIFSSTGVSLNELLLSQGLVEARTDVCQSELLQSCYMEMEAEAISPKRITDFLWKPISESNGNLAVLVDPFQISVFVSGAVNDSLINTGPSNGRGTTARSASFPGSRFGSNVLVEFFDENGKRVLLNNGERSIVIPNGADRVRSFY